MGNIMSYILHTDVLLHNKMTNEGQEWCSMFARVSPSGTGSQCNDETSKWKCDFLPLCIEGSCHYCICSVGLKNFYFSHLLKKRPLSLPQQACILFTIHVSETLPFHDWIWNTILQNAFWQLSTQLFYDRMKRFWCMSPQNTTEAKLMIQDEPVSHPKTHWETFNFWVFLHWDDFCKMIGPSCTIRMLFKCQVFSLCPSVTWK